MNISVYMYVHICNDIWNGVDMHVTYVYICMRTYICICASLHREVHRGLYGGWLVKCLFLGVVACLITLTLMLMLALKTVCALIDVFCVSMYFLFC